MAFADNRHSRFVQIAKIALPLLALGLLSTMFLFSRSVDIESAIPMVDVDPQEIAREQRLTGPKFSGVTSDGSTVTVTAETARPDLTNPRRLTAEDVATNILTTTGTQIMILAESAVFEGSADRLDLNGNVRINTSTGYQLLTDALTASLSEETIKTPGAITGTSTNGTLQAGQMEVFLQDGLHVLVFKGGVKLVYDPQN